MIQTIIASLEEKLTSKARDLDNHQGQLDELHKNADRLNRLSSGTAASLNSLAFLSAGWPRLPKKCLIPIEQRETIKALQLEKATMQAQLAQATSQGFHIPLS